MNSLIENGYISELLCGSNYSLILNDNSTFSPTEYKVLQTQTDSGFVKCMKMLNNGRIQLFYVIEELKSLSSILPTLDANSFMIIVSNLIANIIDIKHNGFLSCQNLDISFDRIYVDQTNYKVYLIYCPFNRHLFEGYSIFENELRTSLIKLISDNKQLNSVKTNYLSSDLSNGMLSLEDISSDIKTVVRSGKSAGIHLDNQQPQEGRGSRLKISSLNPLIDADFKVDQDEFLLGKNPTAVDGVISGNQMISRVHCKIIRRDGRFYIVDLQSKNGTYVNNVRVSANATKLIVSGDIIRLASSEFKVTII